MKTFLQHVLTIFVTMFLHGVLMAVHHNLWDREFEACKVELGENYTIPKAAKCAKRSTTMRVLATILHQEGTFFEGND